MTLLPGGRDQQISEEMIEAAAIAMWQDVSDRLRGNGFEPNAIPSDYLGHARAMLAVVLPLLPAEAAIRAKIADEIDAHRVHYDECDHCEALRSAANIARGSATEETRP